MSKKCIFAKTEILLELKTINKEYLKVYPDNTPKSIRLMKIYSKMAVIELSGWIEDGMKELMQISIKKLKDQENQKKFTKMSNNIYGFDYKRKFSRSIITAFGAHGFEFIEAQVGDADIARLSSVLGKLKVWRDPAAHSHVTVIPCNPSQIIVELETIFPIFKKIETSARRYRNNHF